MNYWLIVRIVNGDNYYNKRRKRAMEKTKLVVVFSDEMPTEDIHLLIKDVEETGLILREIFDDGTKMIVEVNSEIPDSDFRGTFEEYWMAVLNDSKCPCCYPLEDTAIAVWEVIRLKDFIKKDLDLNADIGGVYKDIWNKY
jgi:hypothetical protein